MLKQANSLRELEGIKELQLLNLKDHVSDEEKMVEGFVTANYTIEFLQEMNELEKSVVAKVDDRVVGYIIAAPRAIGSKHSILKELSATIDRCLYQGKSLESRNYIMSGQVCIAKDFRGSGLLPKLYNYFRECFQEKYDCCITEVDDRNDRSIRAHLRSGFQIIHSMTSDSDPSISWHFVLWDWR